MAKSDVAPSQDAIELAILGEGNIAIPLEDPEAAAREIVYRILGAETEEEIYEQAGTTHARDILGVPLMIRAIRWQTSRYEGEGPKVYALIDATRVDTGDELLITCGSRNVMAQLYRAAQMGKIPTDTPKALKENETGAGFGALWLVNV